MKINVLVADDDMSALLLMHDALEINFRNAVVERALSPQSFWAKVAADEENPWHLIFLSTEYIGETAADFSERIKAINPETMSKIILTGQKQDFDSLADDIRRLPFLAKPFSLDQFEEMIKQVHG
jgi:response regulator RpfG family c-di-GMP phosphodiesterase